MRNEPNTTEQVAPLPAAPLAEYGSDAQVALPIGRRERLHGNLRTIADIHITSVLESVDDLAIADRVAYVIATRMDTTCLVVATPTTFLITTCDTELTPQDVGSISPVHPTDRIVTVATPQGIVPLLTPHASP